MARSGRQARRQAGDAAKWYDLFSRGARDWLRHDEKVREAVRAAPAADHRRRRRHQRRRAHGARAGAHARALPLPPAPSRGAAGRGAGQGQARRRVRRSVQQTRVRARRAPAASDEGEVQLLLEFKVDDIVDWLWEEMQLPNLKARVGPSEETDWVREGWDRRGARSRLDRRRSFKELVKRRGAPGRDPDLHRRGPALPPAGAAQAAGDPRGRVLPAGRLGQHVRPRPQARQDFLLLGGAGPAARVPLARDGVRGPHHRGLGVHARRSSSRSRGTGGTVASTGLLKVREIIDARYNPARCNIYLFYASDGDNSVSDAAEARGALAGIAADACFTGYVEVSSGLSRQLATETGTPVRRAAGGRLRRRQLRAQRFRRRLGRGAPFLHRREPAAGGRVDRDAAAGQPVTELAGATSGASRSWRPLGPRLPPGGLRGGARHLHDGDRRLRAAGAHAALVVRRALHLPADPAPHGALAPVRGGVPRQPGPRLPRRRAMAWRRTCW